MTFSVCLPLPKDGENQKQWDYALSNFRPEVIYVIGSKDNAPPTNVFTNAVYIKNAEYLPNAPLVVLAPKHGQYVCGDINLVDFEHPENCIYYFGADNYPTSEDQLGNRKPTDTVFIPTDTTDDMFSYVAYGVTIWDRKMKHG